MCRGACAMRSMCQGICKKGLRGGAWTAFLLRSISKASACENGLTMSNAGVECNTHVGIAIKFNHRARQHIFHLEKPLCTYLPVHTSLHIPFLHMPPCTDPLHTPPCTNLRAHTTLHIPLGDIPPCTYLPTHTSLHILLVHIPPLHIFSHTSSAAHTLPHIPPAHTIRAHTPAHTSLYIFPCTYYICTCFSYTYPLSSAPPLRIPPVHTSRAHTTLAHTPAHTPLRRPTAHTPCAHISVHILRVSRNPLAAFGIQRGM